MMRVLPHLLRKQFIDRDFQRALYAATSMGRVPVSPSKYALVPLTRRC